MVINLSTLSLHMPHYCDFAPSHPLHGPYHDKEYGFSSRDESVIFERMAMEIMQAGLSWETVLKKRQNLYAAFDGFNADRVASYGAKERRRLLADSGIIRNRLKIEAIITNAERILAIRKTHQSLAHWLDSHHPRPKKEWVKLFRANFRFMGPEIVGEFLMSLGYLDGAHRPECPVFKAIQRRAKKGA